jgi:hypothetical protein
MRRRARTAPGLVQLCERSFRGRWQRTVVTRKMGQAGRRGCVPPARMVAISGWGSLDQWGACATYRQTGEFETLAGLDVERHPGQLELELRTEARTCAVCGVSLNGRRPDAVYCSDGCRSAARDRDRAARRFSPERRPCPICGTPMAGRRFGAIYCSPTCRVRAWRTARSRLGEGNDTGAPREGVQERTDRTPHAAKPGHEA